MRCTAIGAGGGRDLCGAFGSSDELPRPREPLAAEHDDHPGSIVCGRRHGSRHHESSRRPLPGGGDNQAGQPVEHPFRGLDPDRSWNGKYQQVGNGGFAGSIQYSAIANATSRSYAAASTDDGTSGPPSGALAFINNPDVLLDYGYRAVKATGDDSKAIITALKGQAPNYSYFVGCSDGGREALQEAQRFPGDFDGIIVGSPVNDQVGEFGSSYLYDMQATLTGPQTNGVPDAYIPASKLPLLTNAALDKCLGKDGGVESDLFLNDPRECNFDPKHVQCKHGQDPNTCLTPAQVDAARSSMTVPMTARPCCTPGSSPAGSRCPVTGIYGSRAVPQLRLASSTR